MKGIIQVEYNSWCDTHGQPRHTVREISDAEVQAIYRHNYWTLMRCDELPRGIDLVCFDYAVNSGTGQAVKSLQRVLGTPIDGHLGAVTMAAIAQAAPMQFIRSYMDERRRFLRNLRTFWRFGKGWMSRCDGVEAAALGAVTSSPPVFHADALIDGPLADPDAQSAQIGKAPAETPSPPVTTELGLSAGGLGGLGTAMPEILANSAPAGKFSSSALIWAVVTHPLFWAGVIMLFGAVTTYLWRRKHAQ